MYINIKAVNVLSLTKPSTLKQFLDEYRIGNDTPISSNQLGNKIIYHFLDNLGIMNIKNIENIQLIFMALRFLKIKLSHIKQDIINRMMDTLYHKFSISRNTYYEHIKPYQISQLECLIGEKITHLSIKFKDIYIPTRLWNYNSDITSIYRVPEDAVEELLINNMFNQAHDLMYKTNRS